MRKPEFASSSKDRGKRLGIRSGISRRAEEFGIKKPAPKIIDEEVEREPKSKPEEHPSLDDIAGEDGKNNIQTALDYAEGREAEFDLQCHANTDSVSRRNRKTDGTNGNLPREISNLLDPSRHVHASNGTAEYSAKRRARDRKYAAIEEKRIRDFVAEAAKDDELYSRSYVRDLFVLMRSRRYRLCYTGFKGFRRRNYFDVEAGTVRAKRESTRRYSSGKRISPSQVYSGARARNS